MVRATRNPFTYGAPITDPRRFVGRKEEICQIFAGLCSPDFQGCTIVGELRSGKTSLLNYISHPHTINQYGLDPETYQFVYLDLSTITSASTASQFYEYMLGRIAASVQDHELRERFMQVEQRKRIGTSDLDEFFDRLDERGLRIALLLDEVQNISNNGNFKRESLDGLGYLAVRHRLALIGASRSAEVGGLPWYNLPSTITLGPFSRSDVEDMLGKYLGDAGVSFSDNDKRFILSLAGMQPFLIQIGFNLLFEAYTEEYDETRRLSIVKDAFREGASPYLESAWEQSSEREKTVLALLTLLASHQTGQPSYWKTEQPEPWYVSARGALDDLVNRGLVVRSFDRHALASGSLYQWIARELTAIAGLPDTGDDETRYESRIEVTLSKQKAAPIVKWLQGTNTKYKSLFARWMCDPRTSEHVFDLLTSSNLPFQHLEWESAHTEDVAAEARAPEPKLQTTGMLEQGASVTGLGGEQATDTLPDDGSVCILFTDLEGSTEMLNRLGNEANQELLRVHNDIIRQRLPQYGGTEVKSMGDGFMIAFSNAKAAASCAIDIQRGLEEHNLRSTDLQLKVRMGINTGQAVKEEGDFFGNTVVLAARVMGQASGGQIFTSEPFRKLSENGGDFQYIDRGWKRLKGFTVREHLHEIAWRTESG